MCCCCFCDGLRREGIGLRTGFLFPAVLLTLSADFTNSAMNSFESTRTNSIASRVILLQVENEERAQLPSRQGAHPEQASALEESIFKLSSQLSTISRNQKYFRTRENRNFSTVRSTERRIFNFSVIEGLMMVSMAGLQVFVVRFFFQGARKGAYLLVSRWRT